MVEGSEVFFFIFQLDLPGDLGPCLFLALAPNEYAAHVGLIRTGQDLFRFDKLFLFLFANVMEVQLLRFAEAT